MMKQTFLILFLLLMTVTACQHATKKTAVDLDVSAISIGSGVFNVKLHIPRGVRNGLDKKTIENLTYRMDSCIYHKSSKGDNVYPIYIQAIATANKYVLEYLVEFDEKEKLNIFYTDKYINHKTYPLKLL